MKGNFWQKLRKPFFVLAPMSDVTDTVFRQIILKCGRPDVFYTEFVSCDGLCSEGREELLKSLKFNKKEKPIVVQFFGSKPENFYKCAKLAQKLGFDGIDINMGCPDKKVEKQNAGAKLILNPKLAKRIIEETKRGAGKLPISVKTRIGYNEIITEKWISEIIKVKPDVIIIHGRTKKEMSKAPAHWDEIGKAAKLIKKAGIIAIGNGDVKNLKDGEQKAKKYGLDGIMVGRGIFENPWFFNTKIDIKDKNPPDRIKLLLNHVTLFNKTYKGTKNFNMLKKFFKIYIFGWKEAKNLRNQLMAAKNIMLG